MYLPINKSIVYTAPENRWILWGVLVYAINFTNLKARATCSEFESLVKILHTHTFYIYIIQHEYIRTQTFILILVVVLPNGFVGEKCAIIQKPEPEQKA